MVGAGTIGAVETNSAGLMVVFPMGLLGLGLASRLGCLELDLSDIVKYLL